MLHGRNDYDYSVQDRRTQNGLPGIPDDEPVFLVRSQDVAGPVIPMLWAELAEAYGADPTLVATARAHAARMTLYQRTHYGDGKIPDAPGGALLPPVDDPSTAEIRQLADRLRAVLTGQDQPPS